MRRARSIALPGGAFRHFCDIAGISLKAGQPLACDLSNLNTYPINDYHANSISQQIDSRSDP